jgi:peroxiredoxin Q/BCP
LLQSQSLPYPLLSDESGKLRKALGIKKSLFVIPGRMTFVINKEGKILLEFNNLSHKDHVSKALDALNAST